KPLLSIVVITPATAPAGVGPVCDGARVALSAAGCSGGAAAGALGAARARSRRRGRGVGDHERPASGVLGERGHAHLLPEWRVAEEDIEVDDLQLAVATVAPGDLLGEAVTVEDPELAGVRAREQQARSRDLAGARVDVNTDQRHRARREEAVAVAKPFEIAEQQRSAADRQVPDPRLLRGVAGDVRHHRREIPWGEERAA